MDNAIKTGEFKTEFKYLKKGILDFSDCHQMSTCPTVRLLCVCVTKRDAERKSSIITTSTSYTHTRLKHECLQEEPMGLEVSVTLVVLVFS